MLRKQYFSQSNSFHGQQFIREVKEKPKKREQKKKKKKKVKIETTQQSKSILNMATLVLNHTLSSLNHGLSLKYISKFSNLMTADKIKEIVLPSR